MDKRIGRLQFLWAMKRILKVSSVAAGLTLVSFIAIVVILDAPSSSVEPVSVKRLVQVVGVHVNDLKARGMPVPDQVKLEDLISGGYLSTIEIELLRGTQFLCRTTPGDESRPQRVLAYLKRPGSSVGLAVLGDGSVQSMNAEDLEWLEIPE